MDTLLGLLGGLGIVAGVYIIIWWLDAKAGGQDGSDHAGPGGWGSM